MATAALSQEPTRDAWTLFWADSTQSRCAGRVPGIWQAMERHWSTFARSLPPGTRVLDLGCGAGAVGRLLLAARHDLRITGIDSAQVPESDHPRLDLFSNTPMESLPFRERAFGAVVSQFGFEYGHTAAIAHEIARVISPGARLSLLVHHAESAILRTNRVRLGAITAFFDATLRDAFCAGATARFHAAMATLVRNHPEDALVDDLARALPSRLGLSHARRAATWRALVDALAPERCVCASLSRCCVAPAHVDEWLGPLRSVCELAPVGVLCEPNGDPIAWSIEGSRAN